MRSRCARPALALTALLFLQACAAEGPLPEPPLREVVPPFPCDIFTVDDSRTATGLRVDVGALSTPLLEPTLRFELWKPGALVAWLKTLDGFSTFAPIFWLQPQEVDPDTLPDRAASTAPGSPLFLVNLQAGSKQYLRRIPVRVKYERATEEKLGPIGVMQVSPLLPLEPASLYGVVMTRSVRDVAGNPLPSTDFFEAVRGRREVAEDSPARGALRRAAARMAPLFSYLDASGISRDSVAQAFVFTTQDARAVLASIRQQLRVVPLKLRWGRSYTPEEFPDKPTGAGNLSGVAAILPGELDAPDFRGSDGDVTDPPAVTSTLRIPFLLILPATGDGRAVPVVVLQHGHGGRKELALMVAPELTARGFAVAAVDHMGHGALAHTGLFMDPVDLGRLRGNFVQTTANGLRLVQALASAGPLQVADRLYTLDTARGVGYLGESLGGMTGVGLAGVEPRVKAAVFNVAGGGLVTSLMGGFLNIIDSDKLLLRVSFVALLQSFFDRVDPLSFAGALAAPGQERAVLMQNVVSDNLGSDTVAALASALGASYVCPCPAELPLLDLPRRDAPAAPPGLFYFSSGKHGFLLAESSDLAASLAVRRQAAHFLSTRVIIDPFK